MIIRNTLNKIMSLSPQVLLSKAFRERCVANFKDLPNFASSAPCKDKQFASVLIPMCVRDGEVHILYTLRSTNLKNHSGQVSFPGGKMDGDESIIETALRETEEEIGVPRDSVDVWTILPNFPGLVKNMIITPVLAEIRNFDFENLAPNRDEVDEIFTVPIDCLCNPNNHAHFTYNMSPMPIFLFEKHKIWGITGFITHMFLVNFLPCELYSFNFNGPKYDIEDLRQSKL
ncbi:mitochondrial coenzyme A diphosphatase NUDT8-like [Epargyreus clarus]|uniref:mitochondrial coenzyme A diphosphatase NUDT8-like n=1 Tax=Epargyreus clarus TaxID=520877 RepID=UPI003C2BDC5B